MNVFILSPGTLFASGKKSSRSGSISTARTSSSTYKDDIAKLVLSSSFSLREKVPSLFAYPQIT